MFSNFLRSFSTQLSSQPFLQKSVNTWLYLLYSISQAVDEWDVILWSLVVCDFQCFRHQQSLPPTMISDGGLGACTSRQAAWLGWFERAWLRNLPFLEWNQRVVQRADVFKSKNFFSANWGNTTLKTRIYCDVVYFTMPLRETKPSFRQACTLNTNSLTL